MASIRAAAFTILLFSILSCLAQERVQEDATPAVNFHRWGSVTVFNGLPSDTVRAITQTSDGILWFGTDNGLARFDGRTCQRMDLGDPDSNRIQTLYRPADPNPDGGNDFWVGTDNGAFFYHDGRLKPVDGTRSLSITAIGEHGRIAFGTSDGQLLFIDDQQLSTLDGGTARLKGSDGMPVTISSFASTPSALYIGTRGDGLWHMSGEGLGRNSVPGMPSFINSLAWTPDALVVGTDAKKGDSGIYRLLSSKWGRVKAASAKVLAVSSDASGVWAGTERYGLFHIDSHDQVENFTFANSSGGLRSDTIYSIFTDREGVAWIGTNRGVSRYDPAGVLQEPVSDLPNRNFVRTFFENGNSRFAGTNRGLLVYNGSGWDKVTAFQDDTIYAIGQSDKSLLIGTPTGIYDDRHNLVEEGDTRGIAKFKGDVYAAIAGRGVIDLNTGSNISDDPTARSLLGDAARLWIGTEGHGLLSYDGQDIKVELTPEILKSGTIWRMFEGADGDLWIAGEHGVFVLRDGQTEQVISAEDVRDVAFDGKYVWAATTSRGLVHARRDDRYGWLSSPIGFEQGLPSEKSFAIRLVQQGVMVATNRGVVEYSPGTIAPKLLIDRVLSQRMHSAEELNSSIALDYPQNSLLIEVAGLSSRTFPEEFQYAFTLRNGKGEEMERRLSSDAQFSPHDLKPGDYSVEAIAFNRDLLASDPVTVRFSVAKAPFPRTATALGVLLVIALGGLVWAIFEHRRIRQRNRELAAARFDLANEAERERSRIARDLHDQTLADLRKLMMKSDKGQLGPGEVREEIESVSTEIRRICEDLSPSVLENVGLVPALEFLLANSADEQTFRSDEEIDELIHFPINVQLQIYRIAQEVLANIRRHSDANSVKMSVSAANGRFQLDIRDNGRAFQPSVRGSGRGISNIRSRANLIGGRAYWRESSGGGNVFTLSLPLLGADK